MTRVPGGQFIRRSLRAGLAAMLVLPTLFIALVASAAPASAETLTARSNMVLWVAQGGTNTGDCSDPAAPCATVSYADGLQSSPPGATINVAGTIQDNISLREARTITGANAPGNAPAVIDGNQNGSVIIVPASASLYLDRITIQNGKAGATSLGNGGGVWAIGETVITNSVITNNNAANGGGVRSDQNLRIRNSVISNNSAGNNPAGTTEGGGGVYGPVDGITDNWFSGNTTTGRGGGLFGNGGTVSRNTFSTNTAASGGGGLAIRDSLIEHNTFAGNLGPSGSAIYFNTHLSTLRSNTFSGNAAPAIFNVKADGLYFWGNLIKTTGVSCAPSGEMSGDNGRFEVTANSARNFASDDTCSWETVVNGNQHIITNLDFTNQSFSLGDPGNNGGPTPTILPPAGAIGKISLGDTPNGQPLCPTNPTRVDQRWRRLTPAAACDIGSVQSNALLANTITFNQPPNQNGGSIDLAPFASSSQSSVVSFRAVPLRAPVCAVSGSVATYVNYGTCLVEAFYTGPNSVSPAPPVLRTFVFTAPQPDLTVTSTAGAFGTDLGLFAAGGAGGNPNPTTWAVTSAGSAGCALVGSSSLRATGEGTCVVTATKGGWKEFGSVSSAPTTVTFGAAPPPNSPPTYSGPTDVTFTIGRLQYFTPVANGYPTPVWFFQNFTPAGLGWDGNTLSGSARFDTAGDYPLYFDVHNDKHLQVIINLHIVEPPVNQTTPLVISPLSGTVGTDLALTATGGNGSGAVSFTATTGSANCSLSGVTLSATSAGSCNVTGTKAASNGFNAGPPTTATVNWAFGPQAPTAANDSYSTNEDTALTVAASGVLGNDTDANGDALTAVKVTDPAHGTVTMNANGALSYTPAANYNGPDSFTYKANDGTADSNVATVTITVDPVNDVPAAVNDAYSTIEGTPLTLAAPGVLGNDTDADGTPLTAVKVTDPSHGTVALNADGSLLYTPAANYSGPDSFTYKANDGTADSNVATVNLTVNPLAQAPAFTSDPSTTFTIGAVGTFTVTASGGPAPTLSSTGTLPGWLNFTPATGVLTGTPPSGSVGDVTTFGFKAVNTTGPDATQPFILHIVKAPQTTPVVVTPASGTFGQSVTLAATGGNGTGYVFATTNGTAGGCLVNGNSLSVTSAGTCNVTATRTGDETFADSVASAAVSVNFAKANQTPALTVTSTAGQVGTPLTLTTGGGFTNGTVTWSLVSGTCTLSASAPFTLSAASPMTCSVMATMAGNTNYNDVSSVATNVVFSSAPVFTSDPSTIFTIGSPGTFTVAASGTPTPVITQTAANPPAWLSFDNNTLSGTPPAGPAGDVALNFKATNGTTSDATQPFTLHIVKATQTTPVMVTPAAGVYNGPAVALAATGGNGSGAYTFAATNGTATGCTVTVSSLGASSAGTCNVTAIRIGDGTFADSPTSAVVTINFAKANQTPALSVTSTTGTIGTPPLTLTTAGGLTGGAVTYGVVPGTTTCTLSQSAPFTLGATTPGTCSVIATMAGNNNYNDVSSIATVITFNPPDFDGDGINDNVDPDDDNDGVPDTVDALPFNRNESADSDHDGIGNNADPDDDNDGIVDANDPLPYTAGGAPTVITGSRSGGLTVSAGQVVWVKGASITGPITVNPGGALALQGAYVSGTITATGAAGIQLCGATVTGAVRIENTAGYLLLGDPAQGCSADSFGSSLTLLNNAGGLHVGYASIGTSLTLTGNKGGGPFPDDTAPELEANYVGGALACSSNTPGPVDHGRGNAVRGARSGQCATL